MYIVHTHVNMYTEQGTGPGTPGLKRVFSSCTSNSSWLTDLIRNVKHKRCINILTDINQDKYI